MSWLRKLFGGGSQASAPVRLDTEQRVRQLRRSENALDRLVAAMREHAEVGGNPGWTERIQEYQRLSGTAMRLRSTSFTREELLDLAFEVRPVFSGAIPDGFAEIGPLQDEVSAAAAELREVLPQEQTSTDGRN